MFVFFGGLLVIALITALVAPNFVEWSNYRAEFEKQAGRVLGQKVEVLGSARARLLPLPRIEFTNVRVGSRSNGEAMMVVDSFRVEAELAPLLKGDVVIVNMELQNPRVNIAVGKNGVVDWTARKLGGINPDDVLLENVTITNGSIRLHNVETNQSFEAENINASISARTLAGPWKIKGDLVLNGEKAAIKVTTGRLQEKGIINARVNIQPRDHPYNLDLNGPIGMVDGALSYKGSFKLKAVQGKKAGANGQPAIIYPYKPLPLLVTGEIDARPDAVKVREFKLDIGSRDDPYTITGTAQAAFGERALFKIVAEGQQIDVDRLGKLANSNGTPPSLAERLAVLKNIFDQVPVPPAEGLISLYLPAIVAGDTVIREVGVDILPKKQGWQLSNLSAGLPGRTTVKAQGLLTLGNDFGFTGQLLLASKQPSGFAGWLKGDVDEAIRRLPNAGFSANVILTDRRILLRKLEVVLGETRLKGAFERIVNRTGKPVINTILDGNKIDFDTLQALFSLFVSDGQGGRFADHDLDIKLIGDEFSAFGISAKSVAAALKLADGRLVIDQLEIGNLAGAKISAKGEIDDALNLPTGEVKLAVSAGRADKLLALLQKTLGKNPLLDNLLSEPSLVDNLSLNATIKALAGDNSSKLEVNMTGEAGKTAITVDVNLDGNIRQLIHAKGDMALTLSNPRPQALLRQLAVPVLPLDVDGELKITARLTGIADENVDAVFDLSMGEATLTGSGEIDRVNQTSIRSRFKIALKAPDIDPLLLLAGYSFPGVGEGYPAELSANITSLDSILSINNIEGTLAGQKFDAKLKIDRAAKPHTNVTGKLDLQKLPLEFVAGLVMGESAIEGGLAWSTAPFALPVLRDLDGVIAITVNSADMALTGLGYGKPARNLTANLELNDGDVAIRDARFDWLGGEVTGEISFTQNQQEVLVATNFSVKNGEVADVLWWSDGVPVISGRFDATVNAEGSGASIAKIVASLSGGGSVSINNGSIRKLNPSALTAILNKADKQPENQLEAATASIVDELLPQKPFEFSAFGTAFSIAGGNLRAGNMVIKNSKARLTGGLRLNLPSLVINGNAKISYDAGENALTGSTPEIEFVVGGPIAAPNIKRDTSLLASFLTMRVRERKERQYEIKKEEILENQRLTRMVRLSKNRARAKRKVELERQNQAKLAEQSRFEEQKLLKELALAEEKARLAREAILNKQRKDEDKRRQDELLQKQRQLELADELKRQREDLKRRQEAFDKLLQEQNAGREKQLQNPVPVAPEPPSTTPEKPKKTSARAPKLPAPREIQPTGVPKTSKKVSKRKLPGVFNSVEDRIGEALKKTH